MTTVDDIIRIWSSNRYKDVMLPGLGAKTCGEVSEMIRTATLISGNERHRLDLADYHSTITERTGSDDR